MTPSGPENQQQPRDEGNPARDGTTFRHDLAGTSEAPSPNDIAVTTCDDVACWKCDYNLRGIATDQRCPECGETADDSLHWRFRRTDPDWLKDVSEGMLLVLVGPLVTLVLPVIFASVMHSGSFLSVSFALGLTFSPLWITAFAVALVTKPEPRDSTFAAGRSWARMLRKPARLILVSGLRLWLLLSWAPLVVGMVGVFRNVPEDSHAWRNDVGEMAMSCCILLFIFVCIPMGAFGVVCLAGYEWSLAQRLDSQKLRVWLRRIGIYSAVSMAILILTIAASFFLNQAVILIGIAVCSFFAASILLAAHVELSNELSRAAVTAISNNSRLGMNAGTKKPGGVDR